MLLCLNANEDVHVTSLCEHGVAVTVGDYCEVASILMAFR